MLDILLFGGLAIYFVGMLMNFFGNVFKKEKLVTLAWYVFLLGFAFETGYLVMRGIQAHRLPLSNQFEFAASFSWGIGVILIILHYTVQAEWMTSLAMLMTWAILLYAVMQPREIKELMPALRSVWFGIHIGSAAFSYAAFMLAGAAGMRFLAIEKKDPEDERLEEIDYFGYRLIAIGELLLTVTILIGAIWAEQAWSAFWTWDPKEVWALITWIIYAIYLHLRISQKKRGRMLAWYTIISIPVVLFTFVGVNTLLPGLHSYGAIVQGMLL